MSISLHIYWKNIQILDKHISVEAKERPHNSYFERVFLYFSLFSHFIKSPGPAKILQTQNTQILWWSTTIKAELFFFYYNKKDKKITMLSKPSYDLACPITSMPYSKDNKPMVLVCGHTLASKTIADMQRIEHEDIVKKYV